MTRDGEEFAMFESDIAANSFMAGLCIKIAASLDDATLYDPAPGHGHPPVWILGHLVVSGEMGVAALGGTMNHKRWLPIFGPKSSDNVGRQPEFSIANLAQTLTETYEQFRTLARQADPDTMRQPHGVQLFSGSAIQTREHAITHLLTSHFAFHVSQLSSCRRSAGHAFLF